MGHAGTLLVAGPPGPQDRMGVMRQSWFYTDSLPEASTCVAGAVQVPACAWGQNRRGPHAWALQPRVASGEEQ